MSSFWATLLVDMINTSVGLCSLFFIKVKLINKCKIYKIKFNISSHPDIIAFPFSRPKWRASIFESASRSHSFITSS